MASLDCC